MLRKFTFLCMLGLMTLGILSLPAFGQAGRQARMLVTQAIDENRRVALEGNVRPEASAANDRGPVAAGFPMEHMFLQLKRPAEQQAALDQFINELSDPKSSNYHHWISAEEFGARFGMAEQDLNTVKGWLESHGFTVNAIYPNLAIDFSGAAAQVSKAFHTQIYSLSVNGKAHYANMSDPQIPAALAPAVSGVAALHDFRPHALSHVVPNFTLSSAAQAVVPQDLATIYDLNQAFEAGYSGQGQTIAVIEDSDLYSTTDWLLFRKRFGLSLKYLGGELVTIHPSSTSGGTCTDPGPSSNELEAIVDAEWATAAAPNAVIEVVSCTSFSTFGGLIALENVLTNGSTPPPIVSIGYGISEPTMGQSMNAFVSNLYQLAVAQGVSIFVSSGDSGGAFEDNGSARAYAGITVNGFASTPYNVAVGATDFADTYFGTNSSYWSTTNSVTYGSALSYIPEIPWDVSCGSTLWATTKGYATAYGASGFCANGGPVSLDASGGGPSGCATGVPNNDGSVGNTCAGYPKPSWQSLVGNPADNVRDVPDVALFGSNGTAWGHYAVICFSDTSQGGKSCLGTPDSWSGVGGTSVSAPIMAGIQALANQKTASRWGNPNPVYYALAALDYGSSGNSACDATNGGDSCTFHDLTLGDTAVDCGSNVNCYYGPDPGLVGVLSTSITVFQPAFQAAPGWDFASGIGSVSAWNLLNRWQTAAASQ